MVERAMAFITACTQPIEGDDESRMVFGVERLFQRGHRAADMLSNDIVANQFANIVKAVFERTQLVFSQRPIACVTGEPELDVPHLLLCHHAGEVHLRRLLGRRFRRPHCLLRSRSDDRERGRNDSDDDRLR